jgi:hypothetical protein
MSGDSLTVVALYLGKKTMHCKKRKKKEEGRDVVEKKKETERSCDGDDREWTANVTECYFHVALHSFDAILRNSEFLVVFSGYSDFWVL